MTGLKRISTPYSYSLAVAAGDFVFLGLHRGFGDDFTTQFHDAISRLKKTMAEFDLSLAHFVKINVWLKTSKIFAYMKSFFGIILNKINIRQGWELPPILLMTIAW